MIYLPTIYRRLFVFFSFFLLFSPAGAVLAETIFDYTTMGGTDSSATFNNTTYRYFTIDTRNIQTISSFSLKMNDASASEIYTLLLMSPDLVTTLATSTVSGNNSGIGQETWNFNNVDVSSYSSIAFRLSNSSGSYRTIYYRNDSNQAINWGYTKLLSQGSSAAYTTQTSLSVLTGTLRPDDCPVCEICDYDDEIPYGVPFLNDVTMVTGYTESYDASTSEMLTIEKKYYHVPAVAVFFLCTVVIIVMSRLIAEFLKRISQR